MTPFTGFWRTKDGRFLLIERMTDDHLMNTLFLLRRVNAEHQRLDIEAARRYDAHLATLIASVDPVEYTSLRFPKYAELRGEAVNRGLIYAKRRHPGGAAGARSRGHQGAADKPARRKKKAAAHPKDHNRRKAKGKAGARKSRRARRA